MNHMKIAHLAKNQTELVFENGNRIFFSYQTPVAAHIAGRGWIKTSHRYSVTTSRHVNRWLSENGAFELAEQVHQSELNRLAENGGAL